MRLTEDVDLLIDGDPSNVRRLLVCLADHGESHARELRLFETTAKPIFPARPRQPLLAGG